MTNFVKSDGKTSPILWLWIPLALMAMIIGIELTLDGPHLRAMFTEGGVVEILQALFIFCAVLIAGRRLLQVEGTFLKLWIGLFLLGSIYIAGEEISWGQWIFYWSTPDFWSGVNDQNETNLHNTSSWLDQKPRILLFIGMVVGGLVIPALRRWKPECLPTRFAALYPENHMAVTALGVLVPYTLQELAENLNIRLFERDSEIQELYMYYFILLYLYDLRKLPKSQN